MEHKFKKQYGQNFLSDTNLLKAIVSDGNITQDDEVLEIGAGAGALTKILDQTAKKVVSYEIDTSLQPQLLSLGLARTTFVFADALKEDIKKIESHFSHNYKLVANLPYYITSPLIFKFLTETRKTESLTIMVQKEVAERIVAKAGSKDYGVLSIMCQFYTSPSIKRIVSKKMFYPQPKVDSAVVTMVRKKQPEVDGEKFSMFIKKCFSMRRKTLANNLNGYNGIKKSDLSQIAGDIDLNLRPEMLSIQQFLQLFKNFEN